MPIQGMRQYGALTLNNSSPITGQDIAYFPRLNKFTISETLDFFVPVAFSDEAILDNTDSVKKKRDYKLTIEMQSIDRNDIEFMTGEFTKTTASYTVPLARKAVIDATGEVTDTDLIGAVAGDVFISVISTGDGDEGYLEIITTGTPTAKQVKLDNTTGVLTFDSSLADKPIRYFIYTTYTNIETIGVEDAPKYLKSLSFTGIIDGPRFPNGILIHIPKMDRNTGFDLDISGESTISIEYKPVLYGANRHPIQWAFL
jgi:hypothetical protein